MEMQTSFTMTIDGEAVAGDATFDVFNPATGGILAAAPDCSRAQLDAAVAAAAGERPDVGTVWINEAQCMNPMQPFGGHKRSGAGVENARDGLLEFTNTQVLVVRKMPAAA